MKWIRLILILFVFPLVAYSQSARGKVAEGNRLFTSEKYDEANNKYRDALIDLPDSPQIRFNIGNTQYKKKKYEEAIGEFEKSLSSDDIVTQSKAYYNLGNTLYRMDKLPESILAFTQTLKLNPDDIDAKYNLEFVRKKLKDQAQKQPQDNQQQQQQQQQQEQNQSQQDQQQENQDENQEQKQDQKQDQEQQQAQQDEQKMSKQDAERILDALENDEKDLQKDRKVRSAAGDGRVAKDW